MLAKNYPIRKDTINQDSITAITRMNLPLIPVFTMTLTTKVVNNIIIQTKEFMVMLHKKLSTVDMLIINYNQMVLENMPDIVKELITNPNVVVIKNITKDSITMIVINMLLVIWVINMVNTVLLKNKLTNIKFLDIMVERTHKLL